MDNQALGPALTPGRIEAAHADGCGAGYKDLPVEQLVQMGIFQVTPQFIREMRDLGYPNVTPDELVRLRIHGIDPEFVRSLSGGKRSGDTRKKP